MPNWCNNRLTVKGKPKDIRTFLEFIKGKDEEGTDIPFDFNKIIPMPSELLETDSPVRSEHKKRQHRIEYGSEDWYNWRVKNWGTKWNLSDDTDLERPHSKEAIFSFDTAWAPPGPIVQALAERFPTLEFRLVYCELGMSFAGYLNIYGKDVEDVCYEGSRSYGDYKSFVMEEFGYEEFFGESEEEEE